MNQGMKKTITESDIVTLFNKHYGSLFWEELNNFLAHELDRLEEPKIFNNPQITVLENRSMKIDPERLARNIIIILKKRSLI